MAFFQQKPLESNDASVSIHIWLSGWRVRYTRSLIIVIRSLWPFRTSFLLTGSSLAQAQALSIHASYAHFPRRFLATWTRLFSA